LTLAVSLWALSPKKWKKKTKLLFGAGALKFTWTRPLLKDLTATWLNACSGHQYSVEMRLPEGQRSTAWVKRLPEIVSALTSEVTSLIGKKPAEAIKEKAVYSKPSSKYTRPVGNNEKKFPSLVNLRYLYQPGELEGGSKRATDPVWSFKGYNIEKSVTKPNEPVLYYLQDGPKRGVVREELLVVPPNSELLPANS